MARLSDIDRAERKMVRQRLEGKSVEELLELADRHGITMPFVTTKLSAVNTIMNQYDRLRAPR